MTLRGRPLSNASLMALSALSAAPMRTRELAEALQVPTPYAGTLIRNLKRIDLVVAVGKDDGTLYAAATVTPIPSIAWLR